jgi:hypothetical protein
VFILKIAVNGGKAYIRNLVRRAQTIHQVFPNFCRGDFPIRGIGNHSFHLVNQLGQATGADRAFFARSKQTVQDFLAIEFLAAAILFDDHVGYFVDSFVSGKALIALNTLTATPD